MILPAVALLAGAWGVAYAFVAQASVWWMLPGAAIALAGIYLLGSLGYSLSLPRVAYEPGELLVFLGRREPERVPIDVVEVFFVGQGASHLPPMKGKEPETTNIIVRLADSAPEWKHRDVDPRFAHWCEGYITLRGAWCEPIGEAALRRLNKRLVEVQRERKGSGVFGVSRIADGEISAANDSRPPGVATAGRDAQAQDPHPGSLPKGEGV